MKTSIVMTTINVPVVIEDYMENCRRHGHKEVEFVVVGDRKTPVRTTSYLESIRHQGFEIIYLDLPEQDKWLRRFPALAGLLPYDSVQRRNIGYFDACERGSEVVITIDDDNFPIRSYDYVGEHRVVGTTREVESISSSSGWFNICSLLETEPRTPFYHRGFPTHERWRPAEITRATVKKRIVVNVGLWLGDPDVDTVTRFEEPFTVTALRDPQARIALAPGTLSPFNSQNTAFHADVLPCFFLITLGQVTPTFVDNNVRYDDIWMSYFTRKVADRMGDVVCYGVPLAEQRRNPHDYLVDLRRELVPMVITNKLMEILREVDLTGSTYFDCYRELVEQLRRRSDSAASFDDFERQYMHKMFDGISIWLDAVAQLKRGRV